MIFYLITLPVEFNASSRAIRSLEDTAILDYDEVDPAKSFICSCNDICSFCRCCNRTALWFTFYSQQKKKVNKVSIDAPREMAVKILYDIDKNGAYSNISLGKHLDSRNFKDIDRAFITELVYGILKWKLTIDYIISRFSRVKLKKISPWILNILRIGVYQIIFTDKVPVSAACNESVKLAKRYGHAASSKYVNGVLRNISRDKERIKYPDKR